MAKIWHKVNGQDGFAIYRCSASRKYASYNPANGGFSSRMLPGNLPVEILEAAPKTIRVRGEAWGAKVTRTYLEGERPVTHTIAFRGRGPRIDHRAASDAGVQDWNEIRERFTLPADPAEVSFDNYAYTDQQRPGTQQQVERIRENIRRRDAGELGEYESQYGCNDVVIVELR